MVIPWVIPYKFKQLLFYETRMQFSFKAVLRVFFFNFIFLNNEYFGTYFKSVNGP